MCCGTIVQFGVKSVVIGAARNVPGNVDFLRQHGVGAIVVNDPDCITFMARCIKEQPGL